jgi:3-dehydroquinate synthase
MNSISIKAEHSYQILIDANFKTELKKIAKAHSKVLFLIPKDLATSILSGVNLPNNFIVAHLPSGEKQKSFKNFEKILSIAGQNNIGRTDAIIGVGGGATTDITGFVAATWLRGIDWYAIPTSLAGMVDAAIGGKTGINTNHGKNLVGAFHSPKKVIVDLDFLDSLSKPDVAAGMAEVIKCGFISDPKILKLLPNYKKNIAELVSRSIKVKAQVVSVDFKESKLREVLNYGHTLGHAIEKNEKFKMRHGEAVAIGLVFAAELSSMIVNLDQEIVAKHREILTKFELPISYRADAWPKLLKAMQGDKKSRNGQIRFIGLKAIGKPVWLDKVKEQDLKAAYARISS